MSSDTLVNITRKSRQEYSVPQDSRKEYSVCLKTGGRRAVTTWTAPTATPIRDMCFISLTFFLSLWRFFLSYLSFSRVENLHILHIILIQVNICSCFFPSTSLEMKVFRFVVKCKNFISNSIETFRKDAFFLADCFESKSFESVSKPKSAGVCFHFQGGLFQENEVL